MRQCALKVRSYYCIYPYQIIWSHWLLSFDIDPHCSTHVGQYRVYVQQKIWISKSYIFCFSLKIKRNLLRDFLSKNSCEFAQFYQRSHNTDWFSALRRAHNFIESLDCGSSSMWQFVFDVSVLKTRLHRVIQICRIVNKSPLI